MKQDTHAACIRMINDCSVAHVDSLVTFNIIRRVVRVWIIGV